MKCGTCSIGSDNLNKELADRLYYAIAPYFGFVYEPAKNAGFAVTAAIYSQCLDRIVEKEADNYVIPLKEANKIFDKEMLVGTAKYVKEKERLQDGIVNRVAEILGYARETVTRKARKYDVNLRTPTRGEEAKDNSLYFSEEEVNNLVKSTMDRLSEKIDKNIKLNDEELQTSLSKKVASTLNLLYQKRNSPKSILYSTIDKVLGAYDLGELMKYSFVYNGKNLKTYEVLANLFEMNYVKKALDNNLGNEAKTADVLGITVKKLKRKIEKYKQIF